MFEFCYLPVNMTPWFQNDDYLIVNSVFRLHPAVSKTLMEIKTLFIMRATSYARKSPFESVGHIKRILSQLQHTNNFLSMEDLIRCMDHILDNAFFSSQLQWALLKEIVLPSLNEYTPFPDTNQLCESLTSYQYMLTHPDVLIYQLIEFMDPQSKSTSAYSGYLVQKGMLILSSYNEFDPQYHYGYAIHEHKHLARCLNTFQPMANFLHRPSKLVPIMTTPKGATCLIGMLLLKLSMGFQANRSTNLWNWTKNWGTFHSFIFSNIQLIDPDEYAATAALLYVFNYINDYNGNIAVNSGGNVFYRSIENLFGVAKPPAQVQVQVSPSKRAYSQETGGQVGGAKQGYGQNETATAGVQL